MKTKDVNLAICIPTISAVFELAHMVTISPSVDPSGYCAGDSRDPVLGSDPAKLAVNHLNGPADPLIYAMSPSDAKLVHFPELLETCLRISLFDQLDCTSR
jgi:hypothetical protein